MTKRRDDVGHEGRGAVGGSDAGRAASVAAGRQRFVVLLTAASVVSTLLIGLATDAASSDASWPMWLRPIRDNPWVAMVAVGALAVGTTIFLTALTADPVAPIPEDGLQQTPVTVLKSLPPKATNFTDRRAEIERLTVPVQEGDVPGPVALRVQAINGMAGVGKTTLAVQVAHLLAPQFPDGQIFLNLDGHTPGRPPIRPQDALTSLLLLLGVPPRRVPEDSEGVDVLQARSALWRSLLVGKRMLILFDNVAGYEQVEPLIPASHECLVLVTSRRRIVELDDINVTMEVLSADDAATLFANLSHRSPEQLDREQLRQLVEMSGRLPLAVSLLGARFRQHPSWSLSELLDRLHDEHRRLREMQAGDRAVAAAFDLSYAYLTPERQRFFLHLGVFPGLTIDVEMAAALAGTTPQQAEEHLAALYDESLIEEVSAGSYRFHDLLRQYCRNLSARLTQPEREDALSRLYDFYVERVALADAAIARVAVAEAQPPVSTDSRERAMDWMQRERVNLLACIETARRDDRHAVVSQLSQGMAAFLQHAGPWDQAEHVQLAGIESARALPDTRAEARLLFNLGILNRLMSRYGTARAHLAEAAVLFAAAGEAVRQAFALNQLGIVLYLLADYAEAEVVQRRSLELAEAAGNDQSRANALHDLGMILRETARFTESKEAQSAALGIFRASNDYYGQANALRSLGVVSAVQGNYPEAQAHQNEALELYSRLGDRLHVAYALNEKGAVLRTLGQLRSAEDAHREALGIFQELGDEFGEATSLRYLGVLALRMQKVDLATELLREAVTTYRNLGSRGGEAAAQRELGSALGRIGQTSEALALLAAAHETQVDLRDHLGQVETLIAWGEASLHPEHRQHALTLFEAALALSDDIGCLLETARALEGVGICLTLARQPAGAAASLSRSHEVYVTLGLTQDAERVARLVDRLEHHGGD